MRILLINNHSYHTQELAQLLQDHEVILSDYVNANHAGEHYDVVILSGSHRAPFYAENFAKEIAFIMHTDIPVIGICLGCQLIAHAYGCEISKEDDKIKGLQKIKYIPTQSHYTVYEGHSFCINQLSAEIIGVAASEFAYEIIRHQHKKQRGLQFHPEVIAPHNDGALLFTTILSEIIS